MKTTQLAMSVAVLTALFGLLFSTATPAAATASRCVFDNKAGGEPDSCVFVLGAHTWVDYVRGGVELAPRQSARGHFELFTLPNRVFGPNPTLILLANSKSLSFSTLIFGKAQERLD